MITAPDNSWRYLGPPKTGTTLLHSVLETPAIGGIYSGFRHDMETLPGAKMIVSVRNPFMRALSLWKHALYHLGGGGKPTGPKQGRDRLDEAEYPMSQFLEDVRGGEKFDAFFNFTICRWLLYIKEVHDLIRLESINRDLRRLFPQLPRDFVTPHLNVGFDHITRPYADPANVEAVLNWMAPDFDRFGYSRVPPEHLL